MRKATLFGFVLVCGVASARAQELASYNAPITETSISGISSGAYMAVQFATAWSSVIKGVGAIAGGPYGCSGGMGSAALSTCMLGSPAASVSGLMKTEDQLAAKGAIDPVANIARQEVYLFNGYNDAVVNRTVSNWLDQAYQKQLGAAHAADLFYQTTIGAGHSQVTLDWGGACAANGGEYINNCHYDQAGVILQQMYGALNPPNRGKLNGSLLSFSQAAYTAPASPKDDSMGAKGFVFVPADCAAGAACRVHIAMHGCKQSFDNLGEDFVLHAGYNQWADTNHIIVLYPQTTPTLTPTKPMPGVLFQNPEACWDWWGYLDPDPMNRPRYLTKSGPQIAAIKAMIDKLTAGAGTPAAPPAGPETLVATDATDTAVELAWTAVASASGYEVFRQDPGAGSLHSLGVVAGLSYADSGLRPSTEYGYAVRPVVGAGSGAFSPLVTATTKAHPPKCDDPGSCPVR